MIVEGFSDAGFQCGLVVLHYEQIVAVSVPVLRALTDEHTGQVALVSLFFFR